MFVIYKETYTRLFYRDLTNFREVCKNGSSFPVF